MLFSSSPALASFAATLGLLVPVLAIALLGFNYLRPRWLKLSLLGLCGVFSLWQLGYWLEDASGRTARRHYARVEQALATPEAWDASRSLPTEQSIIALSLLGEGLADYATRYPETKANTLRLTQNALLALLSPALCPFETVGDTTAWARREENLYLSHLNLLLGSYTQQLAPRQANPYAPLYDRLSRYLTRRLQAAPTRNAPSYGATPDSLWVADNAVTLQSLYLYDALASSPATAPLRQQWVQYLETTGSTTQGLPFSELTTRRPPRGCANAWIGKYAAAYAPAFSASLWKKHKQVFKYNGGLVGVFREYPPGCNLPEDYDSGPMVLGIGTSATGLGLSGAKYQGDYYTYYQLINIVKAGELFAPVLAWVFQDDQWTQASNNWLSRAIQFNAAARL